MSFELNELQSQDKKLKNELNFFIDFKYRELSYFENQESYLTDKKGCTVNGKIYFKAK